MTKEDFDKLLNNPEGLNLEFKTAKERFSENKVFDYCAALSNEGGGWLILLGENSGTTISAKTRI